MVNREREHRLYEGLKARLKAHKDDPAKAFAEPFYKYDKAGNRTQQVKAVRVEQDRKPAYGCATTTALPTTQPWCA